MRHVPKEWGMEIWLVNNELYCSKKLFLEPGWKCSLHRHMKKDETFTVEHGSCRLEIANEEGVLQDYLLNVGDSMRIPPGTWHRFRLPRYAPICVILETSTNHDEADVERMEPSGRA